MLIKIQGIAVNFYFFVFSISESADMKTISLYPCALTISFILIHEAEEVRIKFVLEKIANSKGIYNWPIATKLHARHWKENRD